MKKLLFILFAFAGIVSVSAQSIAVVKMRTAANVDSAIVTNAGTSVLILGLTSKKALSIQANFVKVSGTLAGTVTLMGSNDGVNYVAITDATSTPTITTYAVTDAGTYAVPIVTRWFLADHTMQYYKLSWLGTGTMVGYMKARLLAN